MSRILRRARLSRWRDLHPRPPVIRYEHPFPGDLLHLDIKGMTRFQQVYTPSPGLRDDLLRSVPSQHLAWVRSVRPSTRQSDPHHNLIKAAPVVSNLSP